MQGSQATPALPEMGICQQSCGEFLAAGWLTRFERLSQRGHTLAPDKRRADIPLEWVAPGLNVAIGRPDPVSHTRQLAERIGARIKVCLAQAKLSASDIDAVFLTVGSVRLAQVREAITKAARSARIVEGDTFGAVGKGLTLEALLRYEPGI